MINFTINGRPVTAQRGETILNVARREEIYIPTMCYLEKTTPCASCRLCSVEAEGVDGFVLSCNTPPTEGLAVWTDSDALHKERTNIMRMYDVNHPLECGVCDKSGACDLQNKTLEFNVGAQHFTAKEQHRKIDHWGMINYDPSLCILCEKCVHVCNEVIGDDAITLQFGGYSSAVVPKGSEELDCTYCGECIAVCPVGALVSSDFQYRANAWELSRVPATCAHCSAGCALEYEVKHESIEAIGKEKIYRVTNNFEFSTLCGAGRFGFDYASEGKKDEAAFLKAVEALGSAEAIRFSSVITNEEALILQRLKEKLGVRLFNEDARRFRAFMRAYSSVGGKRFYEGTLGSLKKSDGVVVIGSRITTDNPVLRYAVTTAARHNGAKVIYLHPLEDELLQNTVTQFVKYEVGTEEGVMAMLAMTLIDRSKLSEAEKAFFDNLDIGNLSAESNVGEDELALMAKSLMRTTAKTLVVGSDLLAHDRSENIARLAALIERYSDFSVIVVPTHANTLGVSLITELDDDVASARCVGYNASGEFVIASAGEADLAVPAFNQQEGTLTSIDKQVLPTNVALPFEGYTLNDLASALGVKARFTVDYTEQLPVDAGFKGVAFDALENFYGSNGEDKRGYLLENQACDADGRLSDVEELPEFNGPVLYHCNPVLQFNIYTAQCSQLQTAADLHGSAAFAAAAKIVDGEAIELTLGDRKIRRTFKLDETLKGTVALNPTFDLGWDAVTSYRFEKAKIMRVSNES
jgi:NADH-quinone oxidoreductase subunit G